MSKTTAGRLLPNGFRPQQVLKVRRTQETLLHAGQHLTLVRELKVVAESMWAQNPLL